MSTTEKTTERPVTAPPSLPDLIGWLREPELALWPRELTIDQLMRFAGDALAAAAARDEELTRKLTGIAADCDMSGINLTGSPDEEIAGYGMVLPIEDIRMTLEDGDNPIVSVFTAGYHDLLAERKAARALLDTIDEAFNRDLPATFACLTAEEQELVLDDAVAKQEAHITAALEAHRATKEKR